MLEKYKNKLIAHRGIYDNITIPENSLSSFKKAIENQFSIELDIHLIKDNDLVVFHDYSLKRMTNKDLTIEELTTKEIKRMSLLNTNEKIPTLKEVLKLTHNQVLLLIEIKAKKNSHQLIKILLDQLNDYTGEVLIQSFNPKIIKLLKRKTSKYKISLLISEKADSKIENLLKKAISLLNIKYSNPDFLAISKDIVEKKHLKKYLNKMPILIWTIKSQDDIIMLNNDSYIYICNNLPYNKEEKL